MTRATSTLLATAVLLVASYWGFRYVGSLHGAAALARKGDDARVVVPKANPAARLDRRASAPGEASPAAQAVAPTATTAASGARALDIVIAGGRAAPFRTLTVGKGDQVVLLVESDQPGKLEVHGYRKELEIVPKTRASMSFAADITGRFPIDLHGARGAHIEAAALEVLPR